MPLSPGARLGPYEIVAAIGAGGMGEVYRARDARLNRDVAIKVLPASFNTDADRLQRFEQEARAAAALNHPGILAVYDIGTHDGAPYIVSELLEGGTLRARLPGLPIRRATEYAVQIARALAAAHDKGIVHRDLKPENVFVTTDGHIKILDFGLAKLASRQTDSAGQLPTALGNTEPGLILGTMGYMAPEQVRGQVVDYRADLFAFGAILYEMVTGHRAFRGDTPADTVSAILEKQPAEQPLSDRHVPSGLSRIIDRCVEKSPAARFQSTRDLTFALEAADTPAGVGSDRAPRGTADPPRTGTGTWKIAALVCLLAAVALAWPAAMYLRRTAPELLITRFDVTTPPTSESFSFALSPNGRLLAFVAAKDGVQCLWIRPLDETTAKPLAGTEGAFEPFWSPDSRAIGFFADGQLKRADLAGGATRNLAKVSNPRGGTWNASGDIVFSPNTTGPLQRVAETGGAAVPVTKIGAGQINHRWPQFLPGGRRFLFFSRLGQPDTQGLYVGSLDGGDATLVIRSETTGVYVAPGYLLFGVQGALVARPFDAARGVITGDQLPIAQGVGVDDGTFRSAVTVSETGVLATRAGGGLRRQLAWFDRSGRIVSTIASLTDATIANPALSPDGRRLALNRTVQANTDVWIVELAGSILGRFTFGPRANMRPVWSHDGSRMIYGATGGSPSLFEKAANKSHDEQPVTGAPVEVAPLDWSSDDRFLLYATAAASADLWALPLTGTGTRTPVPVATEAFDEVQGVFSPDGNWVAYVSNESLRDEVYVRRFPGEGGKSQISNGGGRFPRWRRDGKELYYIAPDSRLTAVPVTLDVKSGVTTPGAPVPLFPTRLATGANIPSGGATSRPQYVVADDGRFLMNINLEDAVALPITVVLNWAAALPKK